MTFSQLFLLIISGSELLLLVLLIVFYMRLRKSEALLTSMQAGQESLVAKMHFNAELEQEIVDSFAKRQQELQVLETQLEARAQELRTLLEQAEAVSRSPQFLRELILTGRKKGQTVPQLAKATNLSIDEVELILMEAD
ncbi:hypothetical protein [Halodesulfovibrio marinisediminis]|uniref:DUF2802 domain-containing protein n=1 Tax=Halodesulfovibrio marinisediminis DSM 17456 TaxID=1121457 RepID=A0A1N6J1R9_9BACT|nr:hypothetical protein [Halodesulfovibrio marinisediminis]SIO38202.1 hypothetical protein SAMN02745161_3072 [Halodesulfovibrio marinisediminis DSM 17456]